MEVLGLSLGPAHSFLFRPSCWSPRGFLPSRTGSTESLNIISSLEQVASSVFCQATGREAGLGAELLSRCSWNLVD